MNGDRIRERAYFLWNERRDAVRNWLEAEEVESRPPLLLFLGAGASLDVGIPSTAKLTSDIKAALATPAGYPDTQNAQRHLNALTQGLERTYGAPNFEHYQHGLESLTSLIRTFDPATVEKYRVIEGALTAGVHPSFPAPVDSRWLIAVRKQFFAALRSSMVGADESIATRPAWEPLREFLRRLSREFRLHVVTTNYDTIVERALNWGPREQGFRPIDGQVAWRFSNTGVPPALMHIHGSLHFGYRPFADAASSETQGDHEDLFWHSRSESAYDTWFGRSGNTSMAGRDATAGPIITGLQKPDKLLCEPYLSYGRYFQELCRQIPRVMIAGYGCGDQHVNAVLSRLRDWHGGENRVAVLDYWDRNSWQRSSAWGSSRSNFVDLVHRLSGDSNALDVLSWPDPWVPSGPAAECVRVYFRGMTGTVAEHEHQDQLIHFLRS